MRRKIQIYASALVIATLALLAAAAVHKAGISSPEHYVRSPLIAVQLLGLLLVSLTIPLSFLLAIVVAIEKKWSEALCLTGCALLPLLTFVIAGSINPETLIYMT